MAGWRCRVRKIEPDEVNRFMSRLKLMALTRKQHQRFDRCCHGGIVSYRLPLWFRLYAANRSY